MYTYCTEDVQWSSLPYADKWILLCSLLVINSFMHTYCTEDVQYTDCKQLHLTLSIVMTTSNVESFLRNRLCCTLHKKNSNFFNGRNCLSQ